MEESAANKEWQKIGDLLSSEPYQTLEGAFLVLVRSEAIPAEDKVTLGTIKRYGVVADALIMQGGLASELRAGGVKVAGGGSIQSIEDGGDDDDEDDESAEKKDAVIRVNYPEARKYLKLFRDSLSDIYRIGAPVLNK
jgi:hypothetical protein